MVTRVLIADDDPRITEIHQHYVDRVEGFEVIGLSNTLEDTEMQIRVMEPQLILLDIYFPDGSGIDLLKQIRQQSKALDIIPITAAKEVRLLQEALRGGVFDYILKPVVFPRFEQTLKRYRSHRLNLQSLESLKQSDIDRIIHQENLGTSRRTEPELPKGIDPVTLDKILDEMNREGGMFTSEEMAERVGASRTTARRYLEYLVSRGSLEVDVSYGGVGRPERIYRMKR